MVKICPTCGGAQVGCPTCDLPPKRKLLAQDIYTGISTYSIVNWEVQGIDISKWNGNMDFSITKTKCQYVIMRAGYGNEWKDGNLDIYYRDATAQDMPIGLYWYCKVGEDPIKHADSFVELILSHPPQLDIVLDFEQTTLGMIDTLNWILTMDGRVRNRTGRVPMIYTSKGFWDAKVARSSNWTSRKLWDANWTTRDYPLVPLDWLYKTGDHWQWSAENNGKAAEYGSTNGDHDMDLNRYNGTIIHFNTTYGTHIKPIGIITPPPPPGQVPAVVIVNAAEANLRHAPNPIDPSNICAITRYNMKLYPEAIEKDQFGKDWYRLGNKIYIKASLTRLP